VPEEALEALAEGMDLYPPPEAPPEEGAPAPEPDPAVVALQNFFKAASERVLWCSEWSQHTEASWAATGRLVPQLQRELIAEFGCAPDCAREAVRIFKRGQMLPDAAAWCVAHAGDWEIFPAPPHTDDDMLSLAAHVVRLAARRGAKVEDESDSTRFALRGIYQAKISFDDAAKYDAMKNACRTWIRESQEDWWLSIPPRQTDHTFNAVMKWLREARAKEVDEYLREGPWEPPQFRAPGAGGEVPSSKCAQLAHTTHLPVDVCRSALREHYGDMDSARAALNANSADFKPCGEIPATPAWPGSHDAASVATAIKETTSAGGLAEQASGTGGLAEGGGGGGLAEAPETACSRRSSRA
jgi:hypothetical protein